MGLAFLAGAGGYTLGTVIGGRTFDRVRGHPVLGSAQLCAAALLFTIPALRSFWLLLAVLAAKGFAEGFINTGANTLLIWTHREKVGPYMNGLHFFFGLGAFLSPLIVAQVIGGALGYAWAYHALSAAALLAGLGMLFLPGSPQPGRPQREETAGRNAPRAYVPLVLAAALFLFFYVGAEITFGGWIYTYAVTLKLASAAGAAYLTSGFWLSFTVGRLVSIPAAIRLRPQQIIPAALAGCLSLLALGMVFPGSGTILWIMAIGLGFCMAPIWPTGFTLAGQSMPLTGQLAGMVLLGDSFGGMLLPWLVGPVIGAAGPAAMVFLIFGSLVLNLLAFVSMLRLRPAAT